MLRPRFDVLLHERLLRPTRTKPLQQSLFIPIEVAGAFKDAIPELGDYTYNDIQVKWQPSRPSYLGLCNDYEGTCRLGRFQNPHGGVQGILNWRKENRDAVLAYGYEQYDIAHAMPTIIYHYFKDLNLPNLRLAIDLLDENPPNRAALKHVITMVLQGCNVENELQYMDIMQENWYDALVLEAKKIHRAFKERYPGFVALCKAKRVADRKDPNSWSSTAVQIFFNDVESLLQVKSLQAIGKGVINCDALFVPSTLDMPVLQVLNDLHADMGIRYVHKPMQRTKNIPHIDDAILRVHGVHAQDEERGAYQVWKADFERNNFYLAEKDVFITLNHRTKQIYSTSKANMVESRYAFDKEHVKEWIADPGRLSYDRIINAPPPCVVNPRDFNLWGFNNQFRASTLPDLEEGDNMMELVQPVLDIMRCMVSKNEEHYDYLVRYMADSIQNPGIKRAQYIAVFGKQGVGKNEFYERFWMDKIIGPELCASYGSLAGMGAKFEDGWQSKMCVLIHEVDFKDFSAHHQFLKSVTGSEMVDMETKYGIKVKVHFFGRIIMLSNYVNAFTSDSMVARRQGLRCTASSFREVEGALNHLRNPKVQRAFFNYLSDLNLEGWDPELHRVDSDNLREANFMTTFMRTQGNSMLVVLYAGLDRLYELYRRPFDNEQYNNHLIFPVSAITEAFFEYTGWESNKNSNAPNTHLASLPGILDVPDKNLFPRKNAKTLYRKGGKTQPKACVSLDYTEVKALIENKVQELNLGAYLDLEDIKTRVVAKVDKYHQDQIDAGFEYRPATIQFLDVPKTKTAHRNKPGESPRYTIRQGGQTIFGSDDLEEINQQLGEAWVEDVIDAGQNDKHVQILHYNGRTEYLDDKYLKDFGTTMLELRFPAYVHDRTT